MFLDEVILSGIIIVGAFIGLSVYWINFVYKNIKKDTKDHTDLI